MIKQLNDNKPTELAQLLMDLVHKYHPYLHKKAPSKPDVVEIEKLHRIDGYDYDIIQGVIEWCTADSFWSRNILSGNKLRKQFSRLLMEIGDSKNKVYDADAIRN